MHLSYGKTNFLKIILRQHINKDEDKDIISKPVIFPLGGRNDL